MTYATLVTKHPRWSKQERAAYGGQTVVLTDRTDYKGQREGLVISGVMTGVYRWWAEDEIAEFNQDSPGKTIDVSSGEGYHGPN